MEDSLLLTDFILYMFMLLVVFCTCTCIWLLELLQSLLKWIFSQKQVDIAEQDRLRKQNKQNKPDQEKLESSYLLQLEGHEQTLQCFAVRYLTEGFIQVDPVQLGPLQGHYVDVEGIQEEREERDGLENVQLHSLTESDIDDDEGHQQVSSNDIPSAISIRTGERDDRAQTLSELLRLGTVCRQQCLSTSLEHTGQSENRNSSGADDNVAMAGFDINECPRERTVSNFTPYDVPSTSPMSMSTSTPSSNFSNISSEESEAFANEWIRLRTFSEWPLTSIFSTRLARNGWVSLGEEDRACCYSCHVVHEGWRIGDDPDQYHSQNCRFKDGKSNNVPISTTNSHPTPTLLSTQENRSSGNNPNPVQGELQPGFSRPKQDSFSKETSPLTQDTKEISSVVNNGNQSWIPNQQASSQPQGFVITDQQAHKKNPSKKNVDRPKSYAILAVRISSYTDWPTAMTQTPRDLALAGFFYTGYGDCTCCHFCGGRLGDWEAGDDPWVEHAKWFPRCPFVRQIKGQEFIDLVQKRGNQQEVERPQANSPYDTDPPSLENHSNTDSHLNSNVDDQTSLDELENRNSLSNPIFDELTSLKQENTSLKDKIMCKICMEKNVSIVFLPCGHLACCEDCAPAMRKCPICREFFRATVKIFFG